MKKFALLLTAAFSMTLILDSCSVQKRYHRKGFTVNWNNASINMKKNRKVVHSETIQGFFDMPADNVYAAKLMVDDIKANNERKDIVVVSPDVGGVVRSRALAKLLDDTDLAIIDKRRAAANQSEVMNIIGDIDGKVCIVPDDIIDTAGTLCNAANALKEKGAKAVKAYITHPVLSGPAIERLEKSDIDELVVTNSIPLSQEAEKCSKIRVISLGSTIAECIKRLSDEKSLSEMFL